jgi:hypothetical protein
MKSNQKVYPPSTPLAARKTETASSITAMAISKKLLEIKRTSGDGEMTELNMALWKHLK